MVPGTRYQVLLVIATTVHTTVLTGTRLLPVVNNAWTDDVHPTATARVDLFSHMHMYQYVGLPRVENF